MNQGDGIIRTAETQPNQGSRRGGINTVVQGRACPYFQGEAALGGEGDLAQLEPVSASARISASSGESRPGGRALPPGVLS